jgi:hypothetical protein
MPDPQEIFKTSQSQAPQPSDAELIRALEEIRNASETGVRAEPPARLNH